MTGVLQRYGSSPAWFCARARDGLSDFACEATAALHDRRARGPAFDALLTASLADEAFELRALGRGGPPGDPERSRISCFDPLPVQQAQAWLSARDGGSTATPLTLSELYARCGQARAVG